ncbi:MAG TPA: ZIP family metal transporter [Oxalicibacterium sp.]|uniref:ZIP family metal transporter n=1 Tax=Oxalicibacterium sp. TaxID=2766525 RepID=UPI002C584C3C|nr:ZIP family metal transporter [Oxalicibacterium sp.]HWU98163.1 ZIP family metal transporter [Oxalicibacterium sp.]
MNDVMQQLTWNANMRGALLGGGTAALATGLGTLPVLFSQKFSQRTYDGFLGFGAGVMLAATAFSLVMPALAAAKSLGANASEAGLSIGGGILIGAILILLLERRTSGNNLAPAIDDSVIYANSLRRTWLFVFAVALHNLPEGLAIGIAYAGIDPDKADMLATGISIQDVPEGLVVALALRSVGYGRWMSAGLGVISGLIEPVAAVAGVALIGVSRDLLPWGLAAAAGAMLFVICRDIIPESHRNGHGTFASCSLVFGFILMTVLDTALA